MSIIVPVILAGGAGKRLWPLSRRDYPKQFYPLLDQNRSLLQQTALRAAEVAPEKHIITITTRDTARLAQSQLNEIHPDLTTHIIAEPEGRNTAAAAVTAALYAREHFKNPILWIQPADHYIADENNLSTYIHLAKSYATRGAIMTLGIRPQEASEEVGYILRAQDPEPNSHLYRVEKFIEKPERELAEILVANPRCYINSGMFVLSADTLIDEMHRYATDILKLAERAVAEGAVDKGIFTPSETIYPTIRAQAVDKAIMEYSEKLMVQPVNFDWADIGSWKRLWKAVPKDRLGNVTNGNVSLHEARNNLVYTHNKRTLCLGVEGLVIVDTGEMLLVARKEDLSSLQEAVEQMPELASPLPSKILND